MRWEGAGAGLRWGEACLWVCQVSEHLPEREATAVSMPPVGMSCVCAL